MRIARLPGNPIIRPHMDARMGTNINGPSLIRVPHWLDDPLGTYYLYFADHKGHYIRLAYADRLEGPWRMYTPGTLQIEQSHFLTTPPDVPPELQPHLADMQQQRAGMVGVESPVGDTPERILLSTIDLRPDWMAWHASAPTEVLRPEHPWEGSNEPLAASIRGAINMPVNQLRDPAVFAEDGRVFLLYTVAGESGIAIAEVFLDACTSSQQ